MARTWWCHLKFHLDFTFVCTQITQTQHHFFLLTLGVILGFLCGQVCQPVQSRAVALSWWARLLGRSLGEVTGGGCTTGRVTSIAYTFPTPTVCWRCCLCSFCFDCWCLPLWFWSSANTRSCSCKAATTACCRLLRYTQPYIRALKFNTQKCRNAHLKKVKLHNITCEIPFGALGRTRGFVCRLAQGQLALIPHLPLAACTMSPML